MRVDKPILEEFSNRGNVRLEGLYKFGRSGEVDVSR